MAISIKTDWKPMDVPTAMDFNRMENNIAELKNIIEDYKKEITCQLVTLNKDKEFIVNKEEKITFIGVRVGTTVICSATVNMVTPTSSYLRINAPLYVASVSATPTTPMIEYTNIQCFCTIEG